MSDWSSDMCSSDLAQPRLQRRRRHHDAGLPAIEIDGTPEEFEILADRFGVIWTRMREMYGLREGRLLRQQQSRQAHEHPEHVFTRLPLEECAAGEAAPVQHHEIGRAHV